jgi:hypothetical protein
VSSCRQPFFLFCCSAGSAPLRENFLMNLNHWRSLSRRNFSMTASCGSQSIWRSGLSQRRSARRERTERTKRGVMVTDLDGWATLACDRMPTQSRGHGNRRSLAA